VNVRSALSLCSLLDQVPECFVRRLRLVRVCHDAELMEQVGISAVGVAKRKELVRADAHAFPKL